MLLLLLIAAVFAAPSAAAEPAPLRLLVTGDSLVEPLDRQMARKVKAEGGRAVRDPRPGTGITKPLVLDWVRHARKQVRRHKARATVVFIGANDSGRLRSEQGAEVECCRRAWIDAYAARVAKMMRAYRRDGRAHVYWITLPLPRGEEHRPRFLATNYAIAQAGEGFADGVRVVDAAAVLSPGGRYRRRVEYRGRSVVVRDKDGVHLTRAGSAIVRDLVVRELRADELL